MAGRKRKPTTQPQTPPRKKATTPPQPKKEKQQPKVGQTQDTPPPDENTTASASSAPTQNNTAASTPTDTSQVEIAGNNGTGSPGTGVALASDVSGLGLMVPDNAAILAPPSTMLRPSRELKRIPTLGTGHIQADWLSKPMVYVDRRRVQFNPYAIKVYGLTDGQLLDINVEDDLSMLVFRVMPPDQFVSLREGIAGGYHLVRKGQLAARNDFAFSLLMPQILRQKLELYQSEDAPNELYAVVDEEDGLF